MSYPLFALLLLWVLLGIAAAGFTFADIMGVPLREPERMAYWSVLVFSLGFGIVGGPFWLLFMGRKIVRQGECHGWRLWCRS